MKVGLTYSIKRAPNTWFRFEDGTVRVVCSQGHASMLGHIVNYDGSLSAPPGYKSSLHCGHCNEDLPLFLEGWTPP